MVRLRYFRVVTQRSCAVTETSPSASPSPRRTQAQRRASTEAALLSAAADIVVESGVGSLTLARVGERAGYSRGIVTHHFGSKTALIEAVARRAQVGFVRDLEDLPPGRDRFLQLVDGYLAALEDTSPRRQAFVLLWAQATFDPTLGPILRERDEQFRADLREDVSAGVAEGTMHPDLDSFAVAVAVLGQLRGVALQHLLDPAAVRPRDVRRAITEQWRRALSPDPADGTGADDGSRAAEGATPDSARATAPRSR